MPEPQYVLRSYSGGDQVAQLVQPIASTDQSFTIAPTTGWVEDDGSPLGTTGPFTIVVDRFTPQVEKILCRSINVTTGLVTVFVDTDGWSGRGYDGTTAQSHVPNGSTAGVQTCWSADEAKEANRAVFDLLGGGGASLVGVPIGMSIDFRGTALTLPPNFLVENGSAVSRTTYSALFTATTVATTGTTILANPVVNSISSAVTPYLAAGMQATLANSGGAIYTIQSVGGTTVTFTSGTGITTGTAGAITFYPHGAGNGTTTFNLPDSRGRVTAGAGAVGTNTQPTLSVGGTSGEQLHTLIQTELSVAIGTAAAQTATTSVPGSSFVLGSDPTSTIYTNSGANVDHGPAWNLVTQASHPISTTNSTSAVTNPGGGNGHNNMMPYSVATKIIRAL